MIKARLPFSTLSVGGLWNSQLSVQCAQPQPRTLPSSFITRLCFPSARLAIAAIVLHSCRGGFSHRRVLALTSLDQFVIHLTRYWPRSILCWFNAIQKATLDFLLSRCLPNFMLKNSLAWHKWQDLLCLKLRECACQHLQWTFFKLVASWGASFTSTSSLPSNPVRTILHYAHKCETSPLGKANNQMYLLHREENCQIHLKVPDWPVFPSCRNISAVLLLPVFVTFRQECLCLTVFFKDKNNLVFARVLDWWITSEPVFCVI